MGKWLVWLGVATLGWLVWRLWTLSQRRIDRDRARRAPGGRPADDHGAEGTALSPVTERMVQCSVCGVHLPGSEARFGGGRVYCSDAHREAGSGGRQVDRAGE